MAVVIGEADILIRPVTDTFQRDAAALLQQAQNKFNALKKMPVGLDTDKARSQLTQLGNDIETKVMAKLKQLATMAVGGFGLYKVFQTAKDSIIGFNSQLYNAEVGFATLLKSESAAKQLVADLKELSKTTPFEFKDVLKGAQQLLAFGFSAKELKKDFMIIGDVVAGMGKGAETTETIIRALGQIKAKGRVQGEELLQLQEQGIRATQYISDAFGVNGIELQKAMRAGTIDAETAIAAILQGMSNDFGGLMQAQSKNLTTSFSNFRDGITQTLAQIGKPIYDAFTQFSATASQLVAEFANAFSRGGFTGEGGVIDFLIGKSPEQAKAVVGSILTSIAGITEAVKKMIPPIMEIGKQITGAALATVAKGLQAILAVADPLLNLIADNVGAVKALATAFATLLIISKVNSAYRNFMGGLNSANGPLREGAGRFASMGQSLAQMRSEAEKAGVRMVALRSGAAVAGTAMAALTTNVNGVAGALTQAASGAMLGFSVGGPWGAAIGGGLGLLTGLLGKGQAETRKLKEEAKAAAAAFVELNQKKYETSNQNTTLPSRENYKDAQADLANMQKVMDDYVRTRRNFANDIDDLNAKIGKAQTPDNQNGIVTSPAEIEKMYDQLRALEAAKKEAEKLALGSFGNADKLKEAIAKQYALMQQYAIDYQGVLEGLKTTIMESWSETEQTQKDAIANFVNSAIPNITETHGNIVSGLQQFMMDPTLLYDAIKGNKDLQASFLALTGVDFNSLNGDLTAFVDAVNKIGQNAPTGSAALDRLTSSMTANKDAAKAWGETYEASAAGLAVEISTNLASSMEGLNTQLDSIVNANNNGQGITGLFNAMQGGGGKAADAVKAMIAAGKDTPTIIKYMQDYADRVYAAGARAGYTREQIEQVGAATGALPRNVILSLQLQGFAEAISKLETIRAQAAAIKDPMAAIHADDRIAEIMAEQRRIQKELEASINATIGSSDTFGYTPPARGGTYDPPSSSAADKNKLPPGIDFAWLKAQEDAKKNSEEQKKIQEAMDKVAQQIKQATDRMVSALKSVSDSIVARTKELRSSGLERTDIGRSVSVSRIISNLQRDTALQKEFTAGYAQLKTKGFTDDMLQQLGIQGTGSIRQLRTLLKAAPGDLNKIRSGLSADTQAAMKSAAQIEGKMIADAVKAALDEYFASLNIKGKNTGAIANQYVVQIQGGSNPAAIAAATVKALEAKIKK